MEIISLKEITKEFGKKKILDKINLNIQKGDVLGIVGPSGEGKSVLIKILIGFYKEDSGEKFISINPDKIGFSMQENSIYDSLTTKQNLEYFAKIYGLKRNDRKTKIPEILQLMDLKEFENILTKNLSGGTKKRLDIGCALVNSPEIIILDEPFLGLDPERINNLLAILSKLNKRGTTLVITSHIVPELLKICNKIGLVKNKQFRLINKNGISKTTKDDKKYVPLTS